MSSVSSVESQNGKAEEISSTRAKNVDVSESQLKCWSYNIAKISAAKMVKMALALQVYLSR